MRLSRQVISAGRPMMLIKWSISALVPAESSSRTPLIWPCFRPTRLSSITRLHWGALQIQRLLSCRSLPAADPAPASIRHRPRLLSTRRGCMAISLPIANCQSPGAFRILSLGNLLISAEIESTGPGGAGSSHFSLGIGSNTGHHPSVVAGWSIGGGLTDAQEQALSAIMGLLGARFAPMP